MSSESLPSSLIESRRPIYEQSSDIANEERVAERLCSWWELDGWKRNPKMYPIDISFIKNEEITGFAEIKCRTVSKDTYKTYMISLSKVLSAHEISKATGLSCLLIVEWTDVIGWIDLGRVRPEFIGWGGRTDRNDAQDMAPVAPYNIEEFADEHR